jgi:ubiquitin-conjugating enzyme E2 J1
MKPPNIVFLTPTGRFEVGMKICLTVSAHHPETWQPSWSIRTVLTAIIGFMPSAGGGAIGSIDYPAEVRQKMAKGKQKKEGSALEFQLAYFLLNRIGSLEM